MKILLTKTKKICIKPCHETHLTLKCSGNSTTIFQYAFCNNAHSLNLRNIMMHKSVSRFLPQGGGDMDEGWRLGIEMLEANKDCGSP